MVRMLFAGKSKNDTLQTSNVFTGTSNEGNIPSNHHIMTFI